MQITANNSKYWPNKRQ